MAPTSPIMGIYPSEGDHPDPGLLGQGFSCSWHHPDAVDADSAASYKSRAYPGLDHFQGHLLEGPCSKLIEQCDLILWKIVEPPVFVDHIGLPLGLLRDPWPHIRERLLDAWTQRLSREVAHRHDFAGLHGLTRPPSDKELRLSALEVARVNALREGAFISGSSHGKHDLVKGTLCQYCHMEDTLEHRCCRCPALAAIHARHPWAVQHWDQLPRALAERLLPSANPFEQRLRWAFHQQRDLAPGHLQPRPDHPT